MEGKSKAESVKGVVDFKKVRIIFFFGGGMPQLLLSEMLFSILISEFELRGLHLARSLSAKLSLALFFKKDGYLSLSHL